MRHWIDVSMALISRLLMCSALFLQRQPAMIFHFHSLLGMDDRRRWNLTCSELDAVNKMSSPLMLTRLPSLAARTEAPPEWTAPRKGRKGKRRRRLCNRSAPDICSLSRIPWGVNTLQSPRGPRSCWRNQTTTGTAHEFPISVNRRSLWTSPLRCDFGRQGEVYPKGKPMMTSRSSTEGTRNSPDLLTKQLWAKYWYGGKRCWWATHLAISLEEHWDIPAGFRPGWLRGREVVKVG